MHVLIATGRSISLEQMFDEEREENLGAAILSLRSVGAKHDPNIKEQNA